MFGSAQHSNETTPGRAHFIFVVAPGIYAGPDTHASKGPLVTLHASGNFDVKTTAQDDKSPDPLLGRYALDKQYHGELEGIGVGQMLTAGTQVKGSGAYVAIEKVSGSLKSRTGSFVLEHMGTMTENVPQLAISIVPDSGTAGLTGIAGKMTITIAAGGKHSYDLEYTLPKGG